KLHELCLELIPHPPYSLDLVPCEFLLFPNLKICFDGKKFSLNEEVVAVNKYFASFKTTYFSDGIKKLEIRWTN
ncbi:Histone-lysine N-methyltransferase SETMAR, partial [Camponotus floridanus]